MAYHELNGGNIFREHTLREAVNLVNSLRSGWEYAEIAARIALTSAANDIGVYTAAQYLGYWDTEADLTDTDEDVFAVADWLIEAMGWGNY